MNSNRIFQAVGLGFSGVNDEPPSITVKGEYELAQRMVSLARRCGVAVVERAELANALSHLEIGDEIPEELYEAAATLLVELDKV